MRESVSDCRGFKAAMKHAIRTFRVATVAVKPPIRFIQQRLKGRGIPFLREEIARLLPSENISCRVAPGRTRVGLIPSQKIKKQRGVIKIPVLAFSEFKNFSEELNAACPLQKNLLLGCF